MDGMPPARRRGRRQPADPDPLLRGPDWDAVKAYWRRQRQPCARCGGDIDYDTPDRYWRSLDVGHVTDRATAKDLGWTRAEINAISNTQPEHQRCSREAGVRAGNTRRGRTRPTRLITRPQEAEEW